MPKTVLDSYLAGVSDAEKAQITYRLSDKESAAFANALAPQSKEPYSNDKMAEYVAFLKKEKHFPSVVQKHVAAFAKNGNQVGAYLLQNMPLDPLDGFKKEGSLVELILLSFASFLGSPYGYATQRNGEVIQNLIPKKEDADKQLGTGSVELVWHTEDAHTQYNCDYIGLFCLRGDPEAATLVSCVHPEELDPAMRAELEKPQYVISSDTSYSQLSENKTGVITYQKGKMMLKYDPIYTHCSAEAKKALDYLTEYINRKAVSVYLKTGDMLLVDNNRSVHARTLYHPRYDDTDRWLKRVAILKKTVPASAKVPGKPFVINI